MSSGPGVIEEALRAAGLLPRHTQLSLARLTAGEDLLPELLRCWSAASRGTRTRAWLLHQLQAGGRLAIWPSGECRNWLGPRLRFDRAGAERSSSLTAVLSSRLGHIRPEHAAWFAALRKLLSELACSGTSLVVVRNTASAPFIERGCVRFDVTARVIHAAEDSVSWRAWSARLRSADTRDPDVRSWFSPPLVQASEPHGTIPVRDRLAARLASQVYVLAARPGGNMHQLARLLLEEQSVKVHVADDPQLVPRSVRAELEALGAELWPARCEHPQTCSDRRRDRTPEPAASPEPMINATRPLSADAVSPAADHSWLIHCTRAPRGPWPDESDVEYLDALLSDPHACERTPLRALMRILQQGRIRASSQGIRGKFPVVCFTSLSICALNRRKTWRAHRQRWDFLPYGLALSRSRLEDLGARPVIYGDEACYDRLPELERPYFQQRSTRRGKRVIEWSEESEWRIVGDVSLDAFNDKELLVLVPTRAEAERILACSRWPVLPLEL